jgi:hypothetical protein
MPTKYLEWRQSNLSNTPETAAAFDRARASLARGEGIPNEDILREFGLDAGEIAGPLRHIRPA